MTKTKKITNRDVVLLTARNLFLTQGYLATSMDEIVVISKVSKTNIYYYFKSKEELLTAILDQLIGAYTQQMQEIAARSDLPVQERFDLFLQGMAGPETRFLAGCPFLTLYTQMPQEADELRRKVGLFFQDQMRLVEDLLLEGVRKGEFSPSLSTKAVAGLIVSSLEGALFLQHANQDPALLGQTLATLAQLLK
ncbi:TetR/AcrR family transcriptional regulator [Paenibacillus qinlingensis]|uniref:TetR/AcrR family transcriptional regulator n=1 Tax=Paenibacillus qinlingensis TaxID=1837343 RepID=UPI0015675669|nr:TetR/AcrR family transcriptional regulator [Paenibacillus qinlingensis]NQX63879.1 TetR/AcrR family transcriptional regulator [Paenibacillus qinlingensis]